jgi:hypothetical protein
MTSSTSSSNKPVDLPPRRKRRKALSWGLIGVILLIISSEIFIFRNLDFYGKAPNTIGQFAELDHSWQKAAPELVETAIFGDSMGIDGLRPTQLAQAAGVSPDTIFNFSISGGKAYEINEIYQKYSDQMPNLKRAFIVVNEHQLNNDEIDKSEMFRYYAGLGDRFKVMNKDNYGELTLGWALKSFDMRSIWTKYILDKYLDPETRDAIRDEIPAHPHGLEVAGKDKDVTPARAKKDVDRWFANYDLEGPRKDAWQEMIQGLTKQGVEVIILQLPRSEHFETVIERSYVAERQAYLDVVKTTAKEHGATFEIIPNTELDTEAHFQDNNHLNEDGAKWLSGYVAERWMK